MKLCVAPYEKRTTLAGSARYVPAKVGSNAPVEMLPPGETDVESPYQMRDQRSPGSSVKRPTLTEACA